MLSSHLLGARGENAFVIEITNSLDWNRLNDSNHLSHRLFLDFRSIKRVSSLAGEEGTVSGLELNPAMKFIGLTTGEY